MPADDRDRDRDFDEPINPYAPPDVDLDADWTELRKSKRGPASTEPFSASLVIGRSWDLFKARFWIVLGAVLGAGCVNGLYNVLGNVMRESVDMNSTMGQLGEFAFVIAGIFLQGLLTCGQALLLLKVARNEPAELAELFQGGPYFFRYLGASILYTLIIFAILIPCAAPAAIAFAAMGQAGPLVAVAAVVGFVAAFLSILVLSVRLYFYPYVIIDREAGAVESLRTSFELTRGHSYELTGLLFIGGVIAMSGVLMCGVGLFVTIPLSVFMFACTYVALADGFPRDFYLADRGHSDGRS